MGAAIVWGVAMPLILGMAMLMVCLGCLAAAVLRPGVHSAFLGTLALFSIGYYCLPIAVIGRTALRYLPVGEQTAAILMALLFMLALVVGFAVATQAFRPDGGRRLPALRLGELDDFVTSHWWLASLAAHGVFLTYNVMVARTAYQFDDAEAFYADRSALFGLVGFLAGIAQAMSAVLLVRALVDRRPVRIAVAVGLTLVGLAQVIYGGQRLVVITPFVLVLAAMLAARSFRLAASTLALTVATLVVISPVMVAIRQGAWNHSQAEQAANFSFGANPGDAMLQSLADRADLLENMVTLKSYVDRNGHVHALYYWSVLAIPLPRVLFAAKPAVLSDTGTMDGEASVLAWHLVADSSTGSLTAFGSIVAYREGGWGWMIANGLLTGALFSVLLSIFSRGGVIGQAFFGMAFLNWAVRKAPPSLFEMLADVMTYLPVILALLALNAVLARLRHHHARAVHTPEIARHGA